MKTKQQTIDRIIEREEHSYIDLKRILNEELPDFNPMKIDEERLLEIWNRGFGFPLKTVLKEYNSTLPSPLVPLPKEIPELLKTIVGNKGIAENVWNFFRHNYGTPEKQPLPSVEELAKEMLNVWNVNTFNEVAEYVINKYSLHPREWWQDCKKFMHKGVAYKKYSHQVFPDGRTFLHSELSRHDLQDCTPYTTPSAQDIISKHNLTDEEVRVIREGK